MASAEELIQLDQQSKAAESQLLSIAQAAEAENDLETAIEAYTMIKSQRANNPMRLYDELKNVATSGQPEQEYMIRKQIMDLGLPPNDPRGGEVERFVEPALTVGSGIAGEIAGGLGGLVQAFNPFAPEQAGGQTVRDIQEALTYQPRTQAGQEGLRELGYAMQPVGEAMTRLEQKMGTPLYQAGEAVEGIFPESVQQDLRIGETLGAVGESIPTAILEAGGAFLPRQLAKGAERTARAAERGAEQLSAEARAAQEAAPGAPMGPVTEEGISQVAQQVRTAKPEELADIVQPDPEFYQAVKDLGVEAEPLASFGSQNPQFRGLEQGLSAMPGSKLGTQGIEFIQELSTKADNIIEQYGTLDKAELSERFRADSLDTIDDLYKSEGDIYKTIEEQLPKDTKVKPSATLEYINRRANELGGVDKLPPELKKLYKSLQPKRTKKGETLDVIAGRKKELYAEEDPTYGFLNRQRQLVGERLSKKMGKSEAFKNLESGELKQLYAAMKKDQDSATSMMEGLSDLQKSADMHTIKRKAIEENLTKLLGNDLSKDIMPQVGSALKSLSKGNIEKWDTMMNRLPKDSRREIVVSALNDIFKGSGSQQGALSTNQFTKFMTELNRQPTLKKRLYRELPKETQTSLDNLAKISKSIDTALKDKVRTGVVASLFDNNRGFLRQLLGKGFTAAAAKTAGMSGAMAADNTLNFLSQLTDSGRAAQNMLSSPQFLKMIKQAANDGSIGTPEVSAKMKRAEKMFERSETFKNWAKTLDEDSRAKLVSLGLINYLFMQPETEENGTQ